MELVRRTVDRTYSRRVNSNTIDIELRSQPKWIHCLNHPGAKPGADDPPIRPSIYLHAQISSFLRPHYPFIAKKMPISDILVSLLDPLIFLALSVSYLPRTIQRLLSTDGLLALSSWSTIQGAWFNSFWGDAGRRIREGNDARIVALLQGRVSGGQVVDDIASQPLGGTVVDVGPGVGFWVDVFATFNQIPGKMRVLGVEPSTGAHEELRRRVRETGLEGVYEVLPVGIESLSRVKPELEEGSVDCVVSVLCLCSIPQPDKAIRELYWLLKPGGRWYMYEHVRVKRSRFIETYQCES